MYAHTYDVTIDAKTYARLREAIGAPRAVVGSDRLALSHLRSYTRAPTFSGSSVTARAGPDPRGRRHGTRVGGV